MSLHVALLRGINLGNRRITNDDLCAAFESLGLQQARAFLASGNVVFEASGSAAAIRRRIEEGLEAELGYAVPTVLRSRRQFLELAAREPFLDSGGTEGRGKTQVVFLRRRPSSATVAAVVELGGDGDRFEAAGADLLWSPAGGVSQTELQWRRLEELVGPTTVRTLQTVHRLTDRFLR